MSPRALFALLVLALGLFGVLWFTDRQPPVQKLAEAMVLDGRTLRDATWIRWQFPQRQAVEVGRAKDGRFQLQEPIVDIASAGRMEQFVNAWDHANMQKAKLADDAAGRAAAGLETPELTFAAKWADGTQVTVEVGGAGPLADKDTRYVRRAGQIWVADAALYESLRIGLDDLRERQVFRHAFGQADDLKVEQREANGKRETLHLVRAGDSWRIQAPIVGRADPVAAQRFVTSVLSLRVGEFAIGEKRLPEREPDIVVTVHGSYGDEEVRLWMELGHLFGLLPGRGALFGCESQIYQQIFTNAAEQLRARILVPMGTGSFEEILELVLDPGQGRGERVRLSRGSSADPYRLLEPVEYATAPTPTQETAFAVQQLVAREFVTGKDGKPATADEPSFGLGPGRFVATVRGGNGMPTSTLWFGAETKFGDEAAVYCCRADEPGTVVLVQKGAFDVLKRPWTDYCALPILQQSGLVERLELGHRDGRSRIFQLQDDGTWRLEGSPGARPEVGELANDVLRDLVGKRAVDARKGYEQPDFTIALKRRNGDELGGLRLFDRAGEPLFAQSVAGPVAFELGGQTSANVRALWQ